MEWWIWTALGFVLLAAEMLTPGAFYIVFFGLGALATGLLAGLGWAEPAWLQGTLFAALSVASLAAFRPVVLKRLKTEAHGEPVDELAGSHGRSIGNMPARGTGKVELRGTTWNAVNAAETPIAPGQLCRVERVEGLTLLIRPE